MIAGDLLGERALQLLFREGALPDKHITETNLAHRPAHRKLLTAVFTEHSERLEALGYIAGAALEGQLAEAVSEAQVRDFIAEQSGEEARVPGALMADWAAADA